MEQMVNQNFKDKEESASTWQYVTKEVYDISTGSKLFLEIEN